MIRAVIFDFDGVIVDTEALNSDAYEAVLKEYGKKPIFNNGLVQIAGVKGEKNWEILKKKYDISESVEILYKKKRKIQNSLLPQAQLMPGVQNALKRLKQLNNLQMALATMSPKIAVDLIFKKFNLETIFSVVLTIEDCNIPKPHPDIYLKTAEKLKVLPDQCMVIEDSETGVKAGKNAGMFVVALPNKHTKGHDFSKADKIANDFSDITETLLKSF